MQNDMIRVKILKSDFIRLLENGEIGFSFNSEPWSFEASFIEPENLEIITYGPGIRLKNNVTDGNDIIKFLEKIAQENSLTIFCKGI